MVVARDIWRTFMRLLFGEQVRTVLEYYSSFHYLSIEDKIMSLILYMGYAIVNLLISIVMLIGLLFKGVKNVKKNGNFFEFYCFIIFLLSFAMFISVSIISNIKVRFTYYNFPCLIILITAYYPFEQLFGKFNYKATKLLKYVTLLVTIFMFILVYIGQEGVRVQELVPEAKLNIEEERRVYYFIIDESTEYHHVKVLKELSRLTPNKTSMYTNLPWLLYFIEPYATSYVREFTRSYIPRINELIILIEPRYYSRTLLELKGYFYSLCRNGSLSLIFNANHLNVAIVTST